MNTPVKMRPDWPLIQPVLFLLLVLISPVLEELVFRGLLQGWLCQFQFGVRRFGFVSFANISTSILFSLLHLISHPWFWAVAVFIPSIIYGYFRDKYQSVIPAIILHVFYNSAYFYLYPPG